MNSDLDKVQPYPFERLAALLKDVAPAAGKTPISLAIGEPKHAVPELILEVYRKALRGIESYPSTAGAPALREGIARWLNWRFALGESVDPASQVLPVNGTREALFAFAQAVIERKPRATVVMPNPFYQIYEGAALLAGAQPYFLNCDEQNGFLPDLDTVPESGWRDCQLLYLCSPGNPSGAVMPLEQLQKAIELAARHDFVIASDECYSEIYLDEAAPPPGLLQAAQQMGNTTFERCVAFHSLSKRSSVPGMRSGFVAGDAAVLKKFLLYRTYHGSAMSPAVQAASLAAWSDEQHVRENRALYRAKFDAVLPILAPVLDVQRPAASFYLWPKLAVDDEQFTRELLAQENVRVVPGSYLSRPVDGVNPGTNRIRLSLVPPVAACIEAAERIRGLVSA
ncbi:MAG: succinyldiaminopimelate transaminase [Nevskiales bacterium]